LGKQKDAARYYQEAGAIQQAARALQAAGDFFGAGSLLVQAQSPDEAITVLQQVGPESERYLEATIMLGDLFLQRDLLGPAKEKFDKATALRPIAPDFIHPTYQLATIHERQGDLRKAWPLREGHGGAVRLPDVQARVADLRERLAQAPPGGEVTQIVTPSPNALPRHQGAGPGRHGDRVPRRG
jgi:tetratricopeptide (TPR) repeat protein